MELPWGVERVWSTNVSLEQQVRWMGLTQGLPRGNEKPAKMSEERA